MFKVHNNNSKMDDSAISTDLPPTPEIITARRARSSQSAAQAQSRRSYSRRQSSNLPWYSNIAAILYCRRHHKNPHCSLSATKVSTCRSIVMILMGHPDTLDRGDDRAYTDAVVCRPGRLPGHFEAGAAVMSPLGAGGAQTRGCGC